MGWVDHDAPFLRQPDGLIVHGEFHSWGDLDVTPNARVKTLLKRERAAVQAQADKKERSARLEKRSAPADRTAPRYLGVNGRGWVWHVWDPRVGGLVDTGLGPGRRGTGFPPDEWETALADAALAAIDRFRGRPGGV